MSLFEHDPAQPDTPSSPTGEPRLLTRRDASAPEALPLYPRREPSPRPASSKRRRRAHLILRTILGLSLFTVIALITAGLWLRHAMRASLPQIDGTIHATGLSAPVTVTRDDHGVPSITASNLDDLLFAQGFITAQDRLWQMDTLRRHAAGDLAEILGSGLVDHDRTQRTLQIRAAADRALAIYPADQLHQLEAYSRGVNAFISQNADHLPVEFHLLHYKPAPWTPRDTLLVSLAMNQDLSTEFPTKILRESFSAHFPKELLADLYPVGSWRDHPPAQSVPDLTSPRPEIEQIPLDESQSKLNLPTATPADLLAAKASLTLQTCEGCRSGSNNWAVAGSRSASGLPLVSNDMHLALGVPGIWYEASLHIANGTLDVTGLTLPGAPFVVVGRNAHVAWGFTNLGADVQDVYIEHLRNNNTEYQRTDGTWAPIDHHAEHIRVRGGSDVTLDVQTTTHMVGATPISTPIITPLFPSEHRTLSLAWTPYDPANISLPFYAADTATDGHTLALAFATVGGPSLNVVYADDKNHIGYQAIGRIPIRGLATHHPIATTPTDPTPGTFAPPPNEDDSETSNHQPSSRNAVATSPFRGALVSSQSRNARASSLSCGPLVFRCHPEPERSDAKDPRILSPATFLEGNPCCSTASETRANGPAYTSLGRSPRSGPAKNQRAEGPTYNSPRTSPKNARLETAGLRFEPAAYRPIRRTRPSKSTPTPTPQPAETPIPPPPAPLGYTIGSPIPTTPVDALDPNAQWSGYIPFAELPSVVDPTSGVLATANARITPDGYPYAIALNWAAPYRTERITRLLANATGLTPADMLRMQMDVHSELDLTLARRLAYALDHSSKTSKRGHQAADILRRWDGDITVDASAPAIVAATRAELWPMLLIPKITAHDQAAGIAEKGVTPEGVARLYSWQEQGPILEEMMAHTPARWLPPGFANWNDLLATAVDRGLTSTHADLAKWSYSKTHPIELNHPIFSTNPILRRLIGVTVGSGPRVVGGNTSTIKATSNHFGPSERFTADLSNPAATTSNITTGQSGNPDSPWYLDQLPHWLNGTTLPLPLHNAPTTHTLTLQP